MRTWVLAELPSPEALVSATARVREAGFHELDTYSPFPLHGVDEALGLKRSPMSRIALAGALTGAIGALLMQWWMNGVDYPLNVGNRPSLGPVLIPVTFESSVLIASLSIVVGLLVLCGLPRPYHPVFEVEAFRSASTHGFWLSVQVEGAERRGELEKKLQELGATQVSVVQEEA